MKREEMSLLFDVWLLMHLVSGALDDALVDSGLNADDFGLYSLLAVFGPATPTQIARWTGMRPTTVSAAIKRMEGRGHATRRKNPDDGRSYLVALNAAGERAHRRAAGPFVDVMGALEGELGVAVIDERLSLQRLDAALREVGALDARPYHLTESSAATTLAYAGRPLSPSQERDVLAYVDFVRAKIP
jgi:DNA-binding MarR family transcriptional regulator